MEITPLNILLLWDYAGKTSSTVAVHVAALVRESRHHIHALKIKGDILPSLDLNRFDVIVVHYSLAIAANADVSQETREKLARCEALKALFIQDEYRFVDKSIASMKDAGIDILFTCVPENEICKVYSQASLPNVDKINVLTGYVDESLLAFPVPPYNARSIDIGYRARKVPAWLGELGQEKWNIGQRVGHDASRYGLHVDLAYREEERLYGDAWLNFVSNCKATLGVESGASVFDFSGEVQANVEAAQLADPDVEFIDIQKRYFAELEGKIYLNQISPRCFEAAALKTLMILYEGEYSGRLTPWKHYLPLKKDHSNFAEIISILRDEARAQEIIENAYKEVALNSLNSFKAMAEIFDNSIERRLGSAYAPVINPYGALELSDIQRRNDRLNSRRLRSRSLFTWAYFFLFGKLLGFTPESFRDRVQSWLRKCHKRALRRFFKR